ncbi:MAG: hypothetical protein M1821_009028 [Bathelium mastoideum]|nr:MAG: hypothetical protein M1821_009028 [Bathelium mastoideum]
MEVYVNASVQNTPTFPQYLFLYSSTYIASDGSTPNGGNISRNFEPIHLDWGYWEFANLEEQARARELGLYLPEHVLWATRCATQMGLRDSSAAMILETGHRVQCEDLDKINLVWVPGRLDGTKGWQNGKPTSAQRHIAEISKRRGRHVLPDVAVEEHFVYSGSYFRWYLEPNANLKYVHKWLDYPRQNKLHLKPPTIESVTAGYPEWRDRPLFDESRAAPAECRNRLQFYLRYADRRLKPTRQLKYKQPARPTLDVGPDNVMSCHPALDGAGEKDFEQLCNDINETRGVGFKQEYWSKPPPVRNADGEIVKHPTDPAFDVLDYPHLPMRINEKGGCWENIAWKRLDSRITQKDVDARRVVPRTRKRDLEAREVSLTANTASQSTPREIKPMPRGRRPGPRKNNNQYMAPGQHVINIDAEASWSEANMAEDLAKMQNIPINGVADKSVQERGPRTKKPRRHDHLQFNDASQQPPLFDEHMPNYLDMMANNFAFNTSAASLLNANHATQGQDAFSDILAQGEKPFMYDNPGPWAASSTSFSMQPSDVFEISRETFNKESDQKENPYNAPGLSYGTYENELALANESLSTPQQYISSMGRSQTTENFPSNSMYPSTWANGPIAEPQEFSSSIPNGTGTELTNYQGSGFAPSTDYPQPLSVDTSMSYEHGVQDIRVNKPSWHRAIPVQYSHPYLTDEEEAMMLLEQDRQDFDQDRETSASQPSPVRGETIGAAGQQSVMASQMGQNIIDVDGPDTTNSSTVTTDTSSSNDPFYYMPRIEQWEKETLEPLISMLPQDSEVASIDINDMLPAALKSGDSESGPNTSLSEDGLGVNNASGTRVAQHDDARNIIPSEEDIQKILDVMGKENAVVGHNDTTNDFSIQAPDPQPSNQETNTWNGLNLDTPDQGPYSWHNLFASDNPNSPFYLGPIPSQFVSPPQVLVPDASNMTFGSSQDVASMSVPGNWVSDSPPQLNSSHNVFEPGVENNVGAGDAPDPYDSVFSNWINTDDPQNIAGPVLGSSFSHSNGNSA